VPRQISRYGWIPDLPDHRDHMYAVPPPVMAALPPSADLRADCPPVYDQGQLGSCTGNAIAGAIEFEQISQKMQSTFIPSRLFIYYNERDMEGTVNSDAGAMIRDGIKSVNQVGVCPEDQWQYDPNNFATKPDQSCYDTAAQHTTVSYQSVVQQLNQLKGCLAEGYPFVFGFSVYESFEGPDVAASGHLSMPAPTEKQLGGHAVLAVGYDDANQWFLVRNSWGDSWGMAGYFTIPYSYLTDQNLANDFWTIRWVQ
jgi:C1A family cysteine protease